MAFTIFASFTTVSAAEMNANFQWVGGSHWLPRGGASLASTTGVYDLGSTVHKWDNIYTNNINVSGQSCTGFWNLVAQVTLSTTATSIEFTGLDKDIYMIEGIILSVQSIGTSLLAMMRFNYDSGTNYGAKYRIMSNTSLELYQTSSAQDIDLGWLYTPATSTNKQLVFNAIIYTKTGSERLCIINSIDSVNNFSSGRKIYGGGIWNNTTDTLTSIHLKATLIIGPIQRYFQPNSSIRLWSPL
jgi:hypothetical protein